MRLAIVILAGGKSRRMGRDKALLTYGGATLLARTVALASQIVNAAQIFVVGRERPTEWLKTDRTVFLPDDTPGDGPLAAIATALGHAETIGCDHIAVLSCDLPLLTADALFWLVEQASDPDGSEEGVAIIGSGARVEPLFSIYTARCRKHVTAQLARGKRSPTALIDCGNFRRVVAPESVCAAIADVDTPEDWEALIENATAAPSVATP